MTQLLPRMTSVEPVLYGFLKISWNDGYDGVIDIRPDIAKGEMFEFVRNKENFAKVRLDEYGHSIFWEDSEGELIDLGADGLRRDCERQTKMHELMVG